MADLGSNYRDFIEDVKGFLRGRQSISPETAVSSTKIVAAIKSESQIELAEGSMINYISFAATKDNSSGIASAGRARGYYPVEKAERIVESVIAIEQKEERPVECLQRSRVFREKALYNIIEDWLSQEEFQSKTVADGRSGPKWSNPDVVGIRVASDFGLTDIEVVSIEVKISMANWRQDIFEAISHKRFANRVYFAVPVIEGVDKIEPDMMRYCEMYRIGVIHIYLNDIQMSSLANANTEQEIIKISGIENIERKIPAPYDFVPPRYQIEFLKQIGVDDQKDLYLFGRSARKY